MAVDVEEDGDAITFVAEVPGLKQEDLKVPARASRLLKYCDECSHLVLVWIGCMSYTLRAVHRLLSLASDIRTHAPELSC